ncbi:MAG: sugar ABC transporter permease, partial [Deltaproteobacteria bacterium]|nr:sugar ABC transporter permease [Deltaproteobacteria bacterium]
MTRPPAANTAHTARRRAATSAVATAAIAATILVVTAAAYDLRLVNTGDRARVELPARTYATRLAKEISRDPTPPVAQAALARITRSAKNTRRIAIVVEPTSTKYRFLRKRRFLADADPKRVGGVLNRKSPKDKALYDLCSQVRRTKHSLLKLTSVPNRPLHVNAATPIFRDGQHWATAIVITEPPRALAPLPAWPLGAAVLLVLGLAAIAGAAAPRRRHLLVMILTAGLAAFFWWWIANLAQGYLSALQAQTASLAASTTSASRPLAAAIDLHGPGLGFILAILAALSVGFLGLVGVGARITASLRDHRIAYTLLIPTGLGMLILVLVPFTFGIALGFFNHHHGEFVYVGLQNFAEILSGGGRALSNPLNFYFTLGVTILWTAVNVFLHVSIGLALALLLKDPLLHFKGLYRALLILPWAMPNYITALIWKGMFHYQYGAVNHVLELVGIEKVSWFSSFSTAFIANV